MLGKLLNNIQKKMKYYFTRFAYVKDFMLIIVLDNYHSIYGISYLSASTSLSLVVSITMCHMLSVIITVEFMCHVIFLL